MNIFLASKWNQHPCGQRLTWNQQFKLFRPEIEVFESSLYHKHVLVSLLFFTSQWKDSLHVFSDCQSISSMQSSPCLCSQSHSILTCNSVKLREASVYFPPLCIPVISLLLPLSYRALFCRLLVYICFICAVIPGSSTVKNKHFCNHILVVCFSNKWLRG